MALAFESSGVGALDVADQDPLAGLLDGRYRVVGRLGGGGMGEVYEVEHVRLQRRFALKVLRRELTRERELTERFDREARAVATLHSDYVVSIVDSGQLADGRPYFVMERLLGQDMRHLLGSAGLLPVPRAVNLAIDVCLGLHAAHSANLVHRDLKPENLFVTRSDDGRERCKLLDFGVVKLGEQDHTRPGVLVGTARYMAPEQVAHGAAVGSRADLFAVGVILYRCLSGQHPFAADSLERVLFRIMNETPAPLGELAPHVPAALSALVARTLSKSPSDRPESALTLARALAPFAGESRNLGGVEGWHVETSLGGDVVHDRLTPSEPTPAVTDGAVVSQPRAPAPAYKRRWQALAFGALLLVVALAVANRVLIERRGGATPPLATQQSLDEARSAAPPPVIAAQPEPLSVAEQVPAPASAAPSSNHSPRARPIASAAGPATTGSSRPSVNWFDPRNPYGN